MLQTLKDHKFFLLYTNDMIQKGICHKEIKCCKKNYVTKHVISQKLKFHQKIKCHKKFTVTNTEILQKLKYHNVWGYQGDQSNQGN